ncbi:MAG: hypothetical protein FWG50_11295 [Kiritimatiellaeota bacterium]|nr:hypothetical protein [Kiritimatiellota bacterium]
MKDNRRKSIWTRDLNDYAVRDMDTLSSAPSLPWGKWLVGVGGFLWLCAKGIGFIAKGEAVWYGRGSTVTLNGTDAVLFGVLWVCGGLFLHFHYFWGNTGCLAPYHHAGKALSALAFVCAGGVFFWRGFVFLLNCV